MSDEVAADRWKPVERDRGHTSGIGPGRQKIDRIADGKVERQFVGVKAVEDIGAVASGTGEDHQAAGPAVARRADAIVDPLIERFV
jgi:hypothetical protein